MSEGLPPTNPIPAPDAGPPIPQTAPDWSGPWPAFCCAILRDDQGRYLLERRPPSFPQTTAGPRGKRSAQSPRAGTQTPRESDSVPTEADAQPEVAPAAASTSPPASPTSSRPPRVHLITCFGGSRERGESPEQCIRRELMEELGWEPGPGKLQPVVRLINIGPKTLRFRGGPVKPGTAIAWFYRGRAPRHETTLITEPGYQAVWMTLEELRAAELSSWHRDVIEAELRGLDRVEVTR